MKYIISPIYLFKFNFGILPKSRLYILPVFFGMSSYGYFYYFYTFLIFIGLSSYRQPKYKNRVKFAISYYYLVSNNGLIKGIKNKCY